MAVVPLLVFLWFTVPRTEDTLAKSLGSSLETKASIAAYGIDQFLTERVVEARVLSQADVLETDDVPARIQYLTEIVEATPWIDDIDIIGVDGVIICSSGVQNEKGLFASEVLRGTGSAINAALKGRQGDVFVSEAISIDSGTGLCFITPITDDSNENVVSLLSTEVSLKAIEPLLNQFLEHLKAYGAKSVCLVDNAGQVVVSANNLVETNSRHPDLVAEPELVSRFETQEAVGSTVYMDADGDEVVAGYADLGEFGKNEALDWSIIATVSLSKWSSGFSSTANQSILFLLASSLIAVAIGAVMSWSVVRRIGLLCKATASVGQEDLTTTVILRGDDELSHLSQDFNEMVTRLRESEDVRERIAEQLTQSNADLEQEAYLKDAQATLAALMRDASDLEELGDVVTELVVKYMRSQMGAFYVRPLGEGEGALMLLGSYAFPRDRSVRKVVTGQELVSQVARSKKNILISDVPEGYVKVTSGLGAAIPRHVLLVPLLDGSQLKGVIELASLGEFSKQQIAEIKTLLRPVAAAIAAKQGTERIRDLLAATQEQAADLAAANKELEVKSTDLEQQKVAIEDRNSDLEVARKQVEENARQLALSSRYKTDFLANMSHEICTPMTAILGFTEIVRDRVTDSESKDWLNKIQRNGDHLLGIINDISKIESNKLDVETLDISPSQILADVASLMSERASGKGLKLHVELDGPIPQFINTDPTRLRQILVNLTGNAITFTEMGEVRLVARVLDADSDEPRMVFDVVDSGIGMTEDQIGNLFQPFVQADVSTTRKFGGSGLGLTISKRLAEMLGGEIAVDSVLGEGSTFSLTVSTGPLNGVVMVDCPIDVEAATNVDLEPEGEDVRLDCRVLLAEDGPDNQKLISFILKKAGADVTIVDDGQIALERALAERDKGSPFDVILMDMQMPVLDGYGATGKLREAGYTGPIIALTAHAMSSDREKCTNAGCDDYTTKPINRKKLVSLIAQYASQQKKVSYSVPMEARTTSRRHWRR